MLDVGNHYSQGLVLKHLEMGLNPSETQSILMMMMILLPLPPHPHFCFSKHVYFSY